ncbi:hypothetical protein GMES_1103 [Paraglaciecola mesophila KMM 241]|uniref:Uncharacterized protein n=1 Tax=Paraglaciecola mesophila KMM 241 TaxID=1128912 RepID=K6YZ23_9ALTE|nr:hypothetical protein GMES_1103 [Paraglaciecola mesophila KMM 241]
MPKPSEKQVAYMMLSFVLPLMNFRGLTVKYILLISLLAAVLTGCSVTGDSKDIADCWDVADKRGVDKGRALDSTYNSCVDSRAKVRHEKDRSDTAAIWLDFLFGSSKD